MLDNGLFFIVSNSISSVTIKTYLLNELEDSKHVLCSNSFYKVVIPTAKNLLLQKKVRVLIENIKKKRIYQEYINFNDRDCCCTSVKHYYSANT